MLKVVGDTLTTPPVSTLGHGGGRGLLWQGATLFPAGCKLYCVLDRAQTVGLADAAFAVIELSYAVFH